MVLLPYPIPFLQLLSLSAILLISLVLIFTSEQNKGIVLYSQRNCTQESGTCIGIYLLQYILFQLSFTILGPSVWYCLNSFWQICTFSAETNEQVPWSSWNWYTAWKFCVSILLLLCKILFILNFIRSMSNLKWAKRYWEFNLLFVPKKLIYNVKLCKNSRAVDTFRDYKYLGTRVRVDGTVGE